ncbi:MAG: hypothetical protein JWP63_6037 [Candidatus Solibacter sp.]|nr:hypothetical protein [Candidatus Solibacter sp.]
MDTPVTRRQALLAFAAVSLIESAASAATPPSVDPALVTRHDASLDTLLRAQITDPASPHAGAIPDDYLMYSAGAAAGLIESATAALVCPQSKHPANARELVSRIRLAAQFLERSQSPEGNIDLLSTNFNSPPDTGFVTHNVATAAAIAKIYGADEVLRALRPFLLKAAAAMATGGIHTPNHRWVVSSALAQIHAIFPYPDWPRRIDQWLAEGIDIDSDGQYIERSTVTYNTVCDRAFTVLAAKLNRPALLDPVRRNLAAMLYLLHPDGEVVTEVSRRQDQFVRGTMAGYWFPVQYLAVHENSPLLAALARTLAPHARLSALLEYPELNAPLPAPAPLPDNYERTFPTMNLARIRRGQFDATLVLRDSSRFFSARNGAAVIDAVRFATSFFGKGQFIPTTGAKEGNAYILRQSLEGPYYQPLDPPQRVTADNWSALHATRRQSQICRLTQSAGIVELKSGFALRLEAKGTPNVPVAVEISLREGGTLEGCPNGILTKDFATYRVGPNTITFGPGAAPHLLTQLRGAEPKLPGQSVYITGYTPFDHTLRFDFS